MSLSTTRKGVRQRLPLIVLFLILASGLLLRLSLITNSNEAIVRVVPDDAFYYLTVARNIASDAGSTFDGVHSTNGYHPLWMLMLIPIARLEMDSYLRFALLLGVALNLFTALILFKGLRQVIHSEWLAVFGAGLYFIWPPVVAASLNGLETSLTTALFAATFYTCVIVDSPSIKYEVIVGSLLAALFLARTDTIFYVVAFDIVVLLRARPGYRRRRAIVVGGIATLGVIPWLLWNWLNFGSIMQSSGIAAPYVLHFLYSLSGHSASDSLAQSGVYFVSYLLVGGPFLWIVLGAGVTLILTARAQRRTEIVLVEKPRQMLRLTLLLWLAGFALIFVHTFIRWYPRPWYFDQLYWLSALTLCLTAEAITAGGPFSQRIHLPRSGRRTLRSAAVLIGCVAAGLVVVSSERMLTSGIYPWQVEMLDSARWLAVNTNVHDASAAFNAGILGYFSGRRVVNLDGVIDNAAFDALQRRDLMDFMRRSNVSFFLDYDPVMLREHQPFLGEQATRVTLEPVATIDRQEVDYQGGNHIQVYRLIWP